MGRRHKKNRTAVAPAAAAINGPGANPKSFVVSSGEVGTSAKLLVKDIRQMLEPNTATRLKERKRNRLRDFVTMAGPLGVTHLLAVSQSSHESPENAEEAVGNVNLKMARMPRGPTLSFKVLRYALSRDILASLKRPHSPGKEFSSDAMLILNNFGASAGQEQEKQVGLMAKFLQNLFPTIRVQSMALTQARRIVLVSYNPVTRTLELRHYLISVRQIGISKQIRRIVEGVQAAPLSQQQSSTSRKISKAIPNLNKAQDVADYILAQSNAEFGYASSVSEGESDLDVSEHEGDTGQSASEAESDAEGQRKPSSGKIVKLPQDYVGRGNKRISGNEKRAVKLRELGPRLELGLVKIQEGVEGVDNGEVLFHQYIHKTKKEVKEIAANVQKRQAEKAQRRKIQEANVARKQAEKEARKASGKKGKSATQTNVEGDEEESQTEEESENDVLSGEDSADESDDFNPEDLGEVDDAVAADVLEGISRDSRGAHSKKRPLEKAPADGSSTSSESDTQPNKKAKSNGKFTMRGKLAKANGRKTR